jgi:hypothetical protein
MKKRALVRLDRFFGSFSKNQPGFGKSSVVWKTRMNLPAAKQSQVSAANRYAVCAWRSAACLTPKRRIRRGRADPAANKEERSAWNERRKQDKENTMEDPVGLLKKADLRTWNLYMRL